MATTSTTTTPIPKPLQSLVQLVNAAQSLSPTERILNDALRNVCKSEVSNGKADVLLINKLAAIRDTDGLKKELQVAQDKSKVLGSRAKVARRLASLLGFIEQCSPIIESLDSGIVGPVVGPVWGLVKFVTAVMKEYSSVNGAVDIFQQEMDDYLEIFEEFTGQRDLSPLLRKYLTRFYESIIKFCFAVLPLLKKSRLTFYPNLLTGTREKIDDHVSALQSAVKRTLDAANAETHGNSRKILNVLSSPTQPANGTTNPVKNLNTLPNLLSPNFTGQSTVLASVKNVLNSSRSVQLSQAALWGIPGVGKTQTALRYAKMPSTPSTGYKHTIFVRAKNEQVVLDDLRGLMSRLGIDVPVIQAMNNTAIIQRFHRFLDEADGWLLIFDNLEDAGHIHKFQPPQGSGHVLYTTRSRLTAEHLCPDSAFQVNTLPAEDGAAMTRSLMGAEFDAQPGLEATVKEVAKFCDGLPLAIEQIVNNARLLNKPLSGALQSARQRRVMLEQRQVNSCHSDELSIAAILIDSYKGLRTKSRTAGALFPLLTCFEPSSIPMQILTRAMSEIEGHFARSLTYERGTVRTREAAAAQYMRRSREPFRLLDHDPFSLDTWKQCFHIGQSRDPNRQPQLPRIDSTNDVTLQDFWKNSASLRDALRSQNALENALVDAEASGLVKRASNNTFWIHDLFASLMRAHIEVENQEAYKANAHMAAMLVYLAYPVPQHRLHKVKNLCLTFVSHAEMCVGHLHEAGILHDLTIGAELAHILASMYQHFEIKDVQKATHYYKLALDGYVMACKRLRQHPRLKRSKDGGMRLIADAARFDYEVEKDTQHLGRGGMSFYPERHLVQFERPGTSAPWRCFNSAIRLGLMHLEQGKFDEAIRYAEQGCTGLECLFGDKHEEAQVARERLMFASTRSKKWDNAFEVGKKSMVEWYGWSIREGGAVLPSWPILPAAMNLASLVAGCLTQLGRNQEALKWLEAVYRGGKLVFGERSGYNAETALQLSTVFAELGEHAEALTKACKAVELVMLSEERKKGLLSDEVGEKMSLGFENEERCCREKGVMIGTDLEDRVRRVCGLVALLRAEKASREMKEIYEDLEETKEVLAGTEEARMGGKAHDEIVEMEKRAQERGCYDRDEEP